MLLVAQREVRERLRDRGFVVSTVLVTLLVLGLVVGAAVLPERGSPTYRLAVDTRTGEAVSVGRQLAATTPRDLARVQTVDVDGPAAARALLLSGEVDAALVDEDVATLESLALVGTGGLPADLVRLVRAAARDHAAAVRLTLAGGDPDLLDVAPLPVRLLPASDDGAAAAAERRATALVVSLLLYGQLFTYGLWVALGVVEEKSGRVVELLLSRVRPRQLLAGKVLGLGALGLAQLGAVVALGTAAAVVLDVVADPGRLVAGGAVAVGWFVLGYAFYATAFAAAAATTSRQADLQNALTPLALVLVASFVVAVLAATGDGAWVRAASLVPPLSCVVMPVRAAAGDAAVLDQVVAAVLLVVASAALVRVAARLYVGPCWGRPAGCRCVRRGARRRRADAARALARRAVPGSWA